MPEELREQMPLLKEVLQTMHIPIFEQEGFEADDILGTLSALAEKNGIVPVVVSGDRDLLQLAGETLKVRIPKTKGGRTETEDYYAADVQAKYGVTPAEFIDMKALMGDASDNIPGVPGIGEKTAAKIITQYHDIETAIAHAAEIKPKKASENLAAYQEQARLSKFLATIVRDMPLEWDKEILKIGADVKGDLRALHNIRHFQEAGFVDLQELAGEWGIEEKSLRKLSAIVLGQRVSKAQRLSNWEAAQLTDKQQLYAATDAWVCTRIYDRLLHTPKPKKTKK